MEYSLRALFLGKTHTVSTPVAGLKLASPKSCSSPTIPKSVASSTDSPDSTSASD